MPLAESEALGMAPLSRFSSMMYWRLVGTTVFVDDAEYFSALVATFHRFPSEVSTRNCPTDNPPRSIGTCAFASFTNTALGSTILGTTYDLRRTVLVAATLGAGACANSKVACNSMMSRAT